MGGQVDDQDRIWHLGKNRGIYTGIDGSWQRVGDLEADDFCVAPAVEGYSHVIMLKDKQLQHAVWSEEKRGLSDGKIGPEGEKIDPPYKEDKPPLRDNKPVALETLAVFSDGVLVIDEIGSLWRWDEEGATHMMGPPGVHPRRMSADGDNVYLSANDRLWRKRLEDLDRDVPWTSLSDPTESSHTLPLGWRYDDLFAVGDGSLLTIIDKKMYVLVVGEWSRCSWSEAVDGNDALQVVKRPVQGADMFGALQALVADFKTTLNRLASTQPLRTFTAPVLAEVKVYDNRLEPASVHVRAGGAVRWLWQHTNNKVSVSSADPKFESQAQSDGVYRVEFDRPGTITYRSGNLSGTIVVDP